MKKEFSLAAALSIVTGRIICDDFGQMHELAEWIMGHPIWTHEFAHKPLCEKMKNEVIRQFPELRNCSENLTGDNWHEWYIIERKRIGVEVFDFEQGNFKRIKPNRII